MVKDTTRYRMGARDEVATKAASKASKEYHENHKQHLMECRQTRHILYPELRQNRHKKWVLKNPGAVKKRNNEIARKGGKRYDAYLIYKHSGLQGEKNRIRAKHSALYKPLKNLIDPNGDLTQLHHEWVVASLEYRGCAIVEKKPHRIGIIKPIVILEGEITLLTEKEVRNQCRE